MSRKTQNYLALLIAIIFIAGLFLPYRAGSVPNSDRSYVYYVKNYSWQYIPFLIYFGLCLLIVGISFSNRIALRLFIIRVLLSIFICVLLTTILADISFLFREQYAPELKIGGYLMYIGAFIGFSYGIIHFKTSYPKYKQMLEKQQKSEADLLDV